MRDLLVVRVDPSRIDDPEIAAEGERDRMKALAGRYSREDLMRAFDLLSRAEFEIESSSQPRHHFEMALVQWIHLRKLTPLTDLIAGTRVTVERSATSPVRPARLGSSGAGRARNSAGREGCRAAPPARGVAGLRAAARAAPARRAARRASVPAAAAPIPRRATLKSRPRSSPRSARATRRLQHGHRAGAEDRRRGRPRDVHVCAGTQALKRSSRQARVDRASGAVDRADGRSCCVRRRAKPAPPAPKPDEAEPHADDGAQGRARQAPPSRRRAGVLDVFGGGDRHVEEDRLDEHPEDDAAGAADAGAPAAQMADMRVEATAGGGMVTVAVNGNKQIRRVKIDPEVVSKDDVEMLQDLIVAAMQRRPSQGGRSARQPIRASWRHGPAGLSRHGATDPLADLVAALSGLPGIGARSAQRLAYHILKTPREEADALCAAILSVKDRVTYCSICSNITAVDPCAYCASTSATPASCASSSSRKTSAPIEKTRGFRAATTC